MSKFARFMKANKAVRENGFYAATKSLADEDGKPLMWEFRHITSKENEAIREDCTKEIPVPGKPDMYRFRLNSGLYVQKLIAAMTKAFSRSSSSRNRDGRIWSLWRA